MAGDQWQSPGYAAPGPLTYPLQAVEVRGEPYLALGHVSARPRIIPG